MSAVNNDDMWIMLSDHGAFVLNQALDRRLEQVIWSDLRFIASLQKYVLLNVENDIYTIPLNFLALALEGNFII